MLRRDVKWRFDSKTVISISKKYDLSGLTVLMIREGEPPMQLALPKS